MFHRGQFSGSSACLQCWSVECSLKFPISHTQILTSTYRYCADEANPASRIRLSTLWTAPNLIKKKTTKSLYSKRGSEHSAIISSTTLNMLSFYWVLDAHYNFDKFFKRSVNHFFSTDLFFESLGKTISKIGCRSS